MADFTSATDNPIFSVHQLPGESLWDTWLRGASSRPHGHCGPIFIR